MDFTKKTREELIIICKERKIKGYSSLKKMLSLNYYPNQKRFSYQKQSRQTH